MNAIVLFGNKQVRRVWNDRDEKWYFPIVDVVAALTDSVDPRGYIKDMRRRDPELAKRWKQIATPLAVASAGGKQKLNCANVEGKRSMNCLSSSFRRSASRSRLRALASLSERHASSALSMALASTRIPCRS